MTRIRILATGAAMAFGLCASPVAFADTQLRYKFKEGDKLTYKTEMKSTTKASPGGGDLVIEMTQTYDQAFTITAVDKEGRAQFTCKFENVRIVVDAPPPVGKLEFDPKSGKLPEGEAGMVIGPFVEALSTGEYTGVIQSTGEISDIRIPEKIAKSLRKSVDGQFGMAFNEDALKVTIFQGIPVLSKDAVAKGKSWQHQYETKIGGAKMKFDQEMTYEGPAKRDGKDTDSVSIKQKISLEGGEVKTKVKSQTGKGSAWLDSAGGRMLESSITQESETETTGFGKTLTIVNKQTVTAKLAK